MKHFSMFAGVGGFELGIGDKSECVGFSEIDKYASHVLKFNYPNTTNYGDCKKIKWSEVPDFDMLVGGSPCQDFSIAGKRKGIVGERSGLVWEFVRCLEEKKPKYFIWENVKGVLSANGGKDIIEIFRGFSDAGYAIDFEVLNAKNFGVPQNRERVFVVGKRIDILGEDVI
jgi:DNA (cytosine-5)-methyltransferase 1